ncbi:MAG: esterase-like activity of phytase family protein [Phycisphaerales bacterium]|nr:esterase-like activity of phytase family protein [Phycisphaerales bacterium]
MRTQLIVCIGLGMFAGAPAYAVAGSAITGLRLVDRYVLPYSDGLAGTIFDNTLVGGLSGIDFDAATGMYYALSDDRSQVAPPGGDPSARSYTLAIEFDENGFLGSEPVEITGVTVLRRPDGTAFPAASVDPESIRVRRDGDELTLYWTSEGAASASSAPPVQDPFVREMTSSGDFVRELDTPDKFRPDGVGAEQTKGVRNNLAFESLTFSTDGTRVYTATESALLQDGPIASFGNGADARIIEFDVASGESLHEYVYPVDAIPVDPQGQFADNGLPELLAIEDGVLLAVERSFVAGYGNHIRIYRVEIGDATDVSGLESLDGADYLPLTKSLLFALTPDIGFPPDNIEGITFGPSLPDGSPTFILVSDNNFNASSQVTHFVLLAALGQGDLDGDGLVNGADLGLLLSQWGGPGTADLNGNGIVDGADLGLLLAAWSA